MASSGRLRLHHALNEYGFYFFLAADHRLANGHIPQLHDEPNVIRLLNSRAGLSGVVMNPGSIRRLAGPVDVQVVAQIMGFPHPNGSLSKVATSGVRNAVRAGANLVSLQINFEESERERQMERFIELRDGADDLGIPVLAMINIRDRSRFNFAQMVNYVTHVAEIGCDLIKINLPNDAQCIVVDIAAFARHMPPLLLSGDPHSDRYLTDVELAGRAGFAGLCVGRNIFHSRDPVDVVRQSCQAFMTAR